MGFKKKVKEAAHSHFSEGSEQPKGFKPRALYEHKKESFIAGALWYKEQRRKKSKASNELHRSIFPEIEETPIV